MTADSPDDFGDREALAFHRMGGKPGKIEIIASKPMATARDLSLAYSPGVAAPVLAIAADPDAAYDYTIKGNLVAVISNGTAILGLGNLGALASKPVMEGKSVLFKRFADIDSIDIELKTEDTTRLIDAIELMEPSFGGINLEDIKAPECFIVEQTLKERMNIPVFHDDQHGTAIIAAAGLINALHLTGRQPGDIKLVVNGAGASAIACTELMKALGVRNAIMCDTKGVIYQGRTEGMNQWKSAHAAITDDRTLTEAIRGADVFLGLKPKGCGQPRDDRVDGQEPDHLCDGQPRSGDHAGGSRRGPAGRHRRHRPIGLSEPDQQCAVLPLSVPRRARRPRNGDQRGDETGGGACAGRTGAQAGAR